MNRYSYICIGNDGQESKGFLHAMSDESARIKLMEQGLKIVRVDLCFTDELAAPEEAETAEPLEIMEFPSDRLPEYGVTDWNSETEFIDLTHKNFEVNLHGLPLSAILHTLAEETHSRKLSHAFQNIAVDLEQGKTVEESFARYLKDVPRNLESLIRAGAQTEKLESILEDYIESQRLLAQSRHKILTSIFYTGVLILGSFLLFYFLMVIIVANFRSIFNDFGTELPGLTLLVLSISDLISGYGLRIISFLILISLGFWFSFDLLKKQAARRRLLNAIPIFGGILSYTSIAQFCCMLATIIEAKIKLPEAIELAAETTRDPNLIAGCEILKKRIKEGFNLTEASTGTPNFSKSFAHIFRWQDRPELFIDSLRASSNIFQAKANMKTGALVFALQPIVLTGIMLIIGVPILALIMPLIRLLNDLS
ncbi:MAG: type II secretion system F family protein [Planctomycetota bacterium]